MVDKSSVLVKFGCYITSALFTCVARMPRAYTTLPSCKPRSPSYSLGETGYGNRSKIIFGDAPTNAFPATKHFQSQIVDQNLRTKVIQGLFK